MFLHILGSIQLPIQWVPEFSLRSVKLPGREVDKPSLFRAQIKNEWSYMLLPTYVFKAWRLSTLLLPFHIRDLLYWLNTSAKISILWHFCKWRRVFWYVYTKHLGKTAVPTFVSAVSTFVSAGEQPAAARLLRSWVRIPPWARVFVCCECRVLSGKGLCDELITRPEESYRLCCVVVCDLETSRMGVPYIYIWH